MIHTKRPKTKAQELRLAANILLFFGIVLTTNYVLSAKEYKWIVWPLVFVVCAAVQYVVTKIESALFSGSIPAPWSKLRSTRTTWIWVGAVIVLMMDILINLGGVGVIARFVKLSTSGEVLTNEFGATESGLSIITGLMILSLALLVAIGPELLKLFADIQETSLEFTEIRSELPRLRQPEVERPAQVTPVTPSDDIQAALTAARRNNNFDIPIRSTK